MRLNLLFLNLIGLLFFFFFCFWIYNYYYQSNYKQPSRKLFIKCSSSSNNIFAYLRTYYSSMAMPSNLKYYANSHLRKGKEGMTTFPF